MNIRMLLTLVAVLSAPLASAADIAGIWKHSEQPAWIEIRMEDGAGAGVVVRNDVYPERVGREILKGLERDESEEGVWRGQVYAEALGEYKDAEVSLPEPGRMRFKVKVGFMSRTVKWLRVDEIPVEPAK
ncbi:MAG: hypothetical protein ACI8QT_002115 [Halioglobus sp.]